MFRFFPLLSLLLKPCSFGLVAGTGLSVTGLRADFFARLAAVKTLYDMVCTRIPSTKKLEQHRWLGTVPMMREWGNGRRAKGLRVESYDVEDQKYEATLEVDRDELDDDQTGQIKMRVQDLALRAGTHKDYLLAQLLINGGTAGFLSYDGVTFFNTAHVSGSSGNQSNALTPAMAGTAPTVAEFQSGLANAIAAMYSYKDDQGQPLMLDDDGLIVIVPPGLWQIAATAINAAIVSSTSNVAFQGIADIRKFPFLTAAATCYLCKINATLRPFIFQDRSPIEFGALEKASEQEFLHEKYLYGVRARYALAYGMWQYCVRMTFTAS